MKQITIISYLVYIMYIYFIGSNLEYIFHRFLMHNDQMPYGKYHVTHHKHTDNDMYLINTDSKEYKDIGVEENLIIDMRETLIISTFVYFFAYIFYTFFPIKINIYFIILVPLIFIIYSMIMWNSIHPYIHYKCGKDYTFISLPCDFTKYIAKNSDFVKWLLDNHKKHHIYKGDEKGNYNITLPGADFLYNTYN